MEELDCLGYDYPNGIKHNHTTNYAVIIRTAVIPYIYNHAHHALLTKSFPKHESLALLAAMKWKSTIWIKGEYDFNSRKSTKLCILLTSVGHNTPSTPLKYYCYTYLLLAPLPSSWVGVLFWRAVVGGGAEERKPSTDFRYRRHSGMRVK